MLCAAPLGNSADWAGATLATPAMKMEAAESRRFRIDCSLGCWVRVREMAGVGAKAARSIHRELSCAVLSWGSACCTDTQTEVSRQSALWSVSGCQQAAASRSGGGAALLAKPR